MRPDLQGNSSSALTVESLEVVLLEVVEPLDAVLFFLLALLVVLTLGR